jgi:hypothetical protein
MSGFPKRASNPSRSSKRGGIVLDLPTVRKMLPLVRHIIAELLANEQQLVALLWEQEGLERNRSTLSWPERQRRYFLQDEATRIELKRTDAVAELKGLGVLVIDAVQGRVGFPTIVNTKPAFFSWQPGEEEVGYWHFAGDSDRRRPIPASWADEEPLAAFKRK